MRPTTVHLNNAEMQALMEFVAKSSVRDFWIKEYVSGIGNKIVVSTSAGQEEDITDYESW